MESDRKLNRYSWLQQKLHLITLSPKFVRVATFDCESALYPSLETMGDHVFVSGLARSGTTILLNAIHQSNLFASLTYLDMPFVLAPNLWSRVPKRNVPNEMVGRAHDDGVRMSILSPEAFEEVYWKTFECDNDEAKEKFKRYIELVLLRYNKLRYLSKNNQNVRRLEKLATIFPKAITLIPFRNPLSQAASLLGQHQNFLNKSKEDRFVGDYMRLIGHSEFGPNYKPIIDENLQFTDPTKFDHWLEQWIKTYQECLNKVRNNPNAYFVCYENLCNKRTSWPNLRSILNIRSEYEVIFEISKKDVDELPVSDQKQKALDLYADLQCLANKWD